MSFNLKPQGSTTQHSSNAPQVDWNAINKQVETDNHTAVISQIVDLGIHTPPLSANIEKSTELDTREEAEALVAQVETMLKKSDFEKVKIVEQGDKFIVNAQVRQPKDRQEVAVFADLVGNVIDYGGEIGQKPYRALLNKTWKGEIRGLGLAVVPPQKQGGVWTFAPNSMLTELAKVTRQNTITDGTVKNDLNNIGLILGKSLMVDVVKTEDGDKIYVNVKGISFDDVSVESLKAAGIRGSIIKKIKQANNYQGSKMQKAIEAYEALNNGESQEQAVVKQPTQPKPTTVPDETESDCPF
ncbi:MAG: hypothetical protein WBP57_00625 [Ignavibacteria bacterium]